MEMLAAEHFKFMQVSVQIKKSWCDGWGEMFSVEVIHATQLDHC